MATFKTSFAAAQDNRNITRESHPSAREVQQPLKFARFSYTLLAALVNGDIIKLGSLQQDGVVIVPELSRVIVTRGDGNTALTLSGKIQSVLGSASAVDETAEESIATGTAFHNQLDRVASGANTTLEAASFLQFVVTALTTGGSANAVVAFDIAYRVTKASG